jgi:hypothetical protein
MKGSPIDQLVYAEAFKHKKSSGDPQDFQTWLQRHLILEVRQEVVSFYGHLDTPEAKYPGLDYCHQTHRIRLSRWPQHRRLFRAFDALRLTPNEIASLTKWEGTKWAKERFEREQGYQIHDTTADVFERREVHGELDEEQQSATDLAPTPRAESVDGGDEDDEELHHTAMDEDMDEDGDEGEDEDQRVEPEFLRRLVELTQLRESGDGPPAALIDEEWEQWFKNVVESGELSSIVVSVLQRPNHDDDDTRHDMPPTRLFPPSMLETARAQRWHEIPDFLHDAIRCALEMEAAGESGAATPSETSTSRATRLPPMPRSGLYAWPSRRSFSDLRLPGSNQRTAPPPA